MAAFIETTNITQLTQTLSKGNDKYLIIITGTKGTLYKEIVCKPHQLNINKKALISEYNKGLNDTSELKYREVFKSVVSN